MTDRTTKALLAAIALGLWVNIADQWVRPVTVYAQDDTRVVRELRTINSTLESRLSNLESELSSLERIARGVCPNDKICQAWLA